MNQVIPIIGIISLLLAMLIWGPDMNAYFSKNCILAELEKKIKMTPYHNENLWLIWRKNSSLYRRYANLEVSMVLKTESGKFLYFNFMLKTPSYLSEIPEKRVKTIIGLSPRNALNEPVLLRHTQN